MVSRLDPDGVGILEVRTHKLHRLQSLSVSYEEGTQGVLATARGERRTSLKNKQAKYVVELRT